MSEMKLIMENWHHYLVEEKIHQLLFEDYAYITGVLGISLPLDESGATSPLTEELKKQILYEQMLFEGFWDGVVQKVKDAAGNLAGKFVDAADGIRQFGKDGWEVMQQLYHVAMNPDTITSFRTSVWKKSILRYTKPIIKTLKKLTELTTQWGLPKISAIVQKVHATISKVIQTVKSLSGWKAVIGYIGLAVGMRWLWNKVGEFVEPFMEQVKRIGSAITDPASAAVQEFIEWIKGTFVDKVAEIVQKQFEGIVEKLTSVTTGIGPWWSAASKVMGAAEHVIYAIKPSLGRFKRSSGQDPGLQLGKSTQPTPEAAPT